MPVYKIADLRFKIEPQSKVMEEMLHEYQVEGTHYDAQLCAENPEQEVTSLFSALCKTVLYQFDGMYLHAGALMVQNKVFLFTAPSGTGKSTHLSLWKKQMGDRVTILNGDKPLLRRQKGRIMVHGTPWQGKERWGENTKGELAAIYILQQSSQNSIQAVSPHQALHHLLGATLYPTNPEGKNKVIDFLEDVLSRTGVYLLQCTPDLSAVDTVYSHIQREMLHED